MATLLIACKRHRELLNQHRWLKKQFSTKDGRQDVFYVVIDGEQCSHGPEGYVRDESYTWTVDKEEIPAFFCEPDFYDGWIAVPRGVHAMADRPRLIIFSENRPQSVHEKLARNAPPQAIMPKLVTVYGQGRAKLLQECRDELTQHLKDRQERDAVEVQRHAQAQGEIKRWQRANQPAQQRQTNPALRVRLDEDYRSAIISFVNEVKAMEEAENSLHGRNLGDSASTYSRAIRDTKAKYGVK